MGDYSLDPQAYGVPCPPNNSGLLNGFKCEQGNIDQGLLARSHPQNTDLLAFAEWSDQRVGANHLSFQLACGPCWHSDHDALLASQLDG